MQCDVVVLCVASVRQLEDVVRLAKAVFSCANVDALVKTKSTQFLKG